MSARRVDFRHLNSTFVIANFDRISLVAGYFTEEVLQTSAFKYIWKEDQEVSKLAQGLSE